MNIRVIGKHCGKEIGLFDKEYLTLRRKNYLKCNHCGNFEYKRKQEVAEYNKIKNENWKREYDLKQWLGVNQGFEFIKETIK